MYTVFLTQIYSEIVLVISKLQVNKCIILLEDIAYDSTRCQHRISYSRIFIARGSMGYGTSDSQRLHTPGSDKLLKWNFGQTYFYSKK